jgi:diguanylate cyclase (GGDEF)-like protein
LARYGGEEFVLLLPGSKEMEAVEVAHSIRTSLIQRPFISYEHMNNTPEPIPISVTASIGVATYPDHCEEALDLIRQADRAMYVGAKQRGRDKVASYNEIIQTVQNCPKRRTGQFFVFQVGNLSNYDRTKTYI